MSTITKAQRRALRRQYNEGLAQPVVSRPGALFYVTAVHGSRRAALLGPYVSHLTALMNVERGRRLADEKFPDEAHWASYGTASAPRQHRLRTRFGR